MRLLQFKRWSWSLLIGVALILPACGSENKDQPALVYGQTLSGKVTYQGKPVSSGFVLVYTHGVNFDPATQQWSPTAFCAIDDGKYTLTNVPSGHVMICVATDPELDPTSLVAPRPMAAPPVGGGPGGPPGFPPGVPNPGEMPGLPPGAPGLPAMSRSGKPLTDDEKATLKEIHAKYGVVGKSPLGYAVTEGAQTFDLVLD